MEKQITLFSETDPKGRITFVNEAFCDVAKFTKEELLGKPHSIIRHPDMPKVIFQYCWRLIENGHVFRGILKNKTKEGEHYWVMEGKKAGDSFSFGKTTYHIREIF